MTPLIATRVGLEESVPIGGEGRGLEVDLWEGG